MPADSGIFVVALVLLYLAIFLVFGVALRPKTGLPMSRRRPDVPVAPSSLTKLTGQAVGVLNKGLKKRGSGLLTQDRLDECGLKKEPGDYLIMAGVTTLTAAVVGFFLGGAGISVAAPAFFGAGGRGATERDRGSSVATVTTVSYLGFICGPPIVGAVSGVFDLRAGIGLLAGTALLLALATASLAGALPLRRTQPAERRPVPES